MWQNVVFDNRLATTTVEREIRDRQFTSIAADSAGLFLAHKLEALKRTQIPSQERNQGA